MNRHSINPPPPDDAGDHSSFDDLEPEAKFDCVVDTTASLLSSVFDAAVMILDKELPGSLLLDERARGFLAESIETMTEAGLAGSDLEAVYRKYFLLSAFSRAATMAMMGLFGVEEDKEDEGLQFVMLQTESNIRAAITKGGEPIKYQGRAFGLQVRAKFSSDSASSAKFEDLVCGGSAPGSPPVQ